MYNEVLVFEKKERVPMSRELVTKHLEHRFGDPGFAPAGYRATIENEERGVFRTQTGIEVVVTPRYVSSVLGSDDDGRGNTICALLYAGEYVALALYNQENKTIIVVEY